MECAFGREHDPYCGERFPYRPETVAIPPSDVRLAAANFDHPDVRPLLPLFRNHHLTEDEDGTSKKYPEVKGDGVMAPPPEPSDEYLKRYAEAAAKCTLKQARDEPTVRFIMDPL